MRRNQVIKFLTGRFTKDELQHLRNNPVLNRLKVVSDGADFMHVFMYSSGELAVVVFNRGTGKPQHFLMDILEIQTRS